MRNLYRHIETIFGLDEDRPLRMPERPVYAFAHRTRFAYERRASELCARRGMDQLLAEATADAETISDVTNDKQKALRHALRLRQEKNGFRTDDEMFRGLPRPKETAAARAKRLESMSRTLEQKAAMEWHPTGQRQNWLLGHGYKSHFRKVLDSVDTAFTLLMQVSAPFTSEEEKTLFEIDLMKALMYPPSESSRKVQGFEYMLDYADDWFDWQRKCELLCVKARELFLAEKLNSEKMSTLVGMFQRLNDVWYYCHRDEDIWRGCLNALQAPEEFKFVCQEKDERFEFSVRGSSYWYVCMNFVKEIHGDKESAEYKQFITDLEARSEAFERERIEKEARDKAEAERTALAQAERIRAAKEQAAQENARRKEERKRAAQEEADQKKQEYAEWVRKVTGRYPVGYETHVGCKRIC